jgi:hypothetical protein
LAPPNSISQPRPAVNPRAHSALPWVLAAIVVLTLLALLTAQLVLLRAQLSHVSSQDKTAKVLLSRADPALAPIPAALRQLVPALRAARRSDPVRSARLARALALQAAPLLTTLTSVDLPTFFGQLRGLAAAATTRSRLATALDAANGFFIAVRQSHLIGPVARAASLLPGAFAKIQGVLAKVPSMLRTLRESKRTQTESLSVQEQSLAIQQQTLALLQRSFAVQQELLQHARSLDSKIP